jgi:trk system potassium uptake protein
VLDLRPVNTVCGVLLSTLGTLMFVPAIVDALGDDRHWQTFVGSGVLTIFVGVGLWITGRQSGGVTLSLRQAFLLTTLAWSIMAGFAALPIWMSAFRPSYAGAYFEAMSALTTTGSTVLVGLDNASQGILLWRALLQGIGGVGIIVLAISILPMLRIGGMQLFRTESSDRGEKLVPRVAQMSGAIIGIYLVLIVVCTFAFAFAGMSFFDAICHALPAISTGGFSTKDASLGFYKNPAIEWVAIIFMLLGSLPFLTYLYLLRGTPRRFFGDKQILAFLGLVAVFTAALWAHQEVMGLATGLEAFRNALFNIVTLISTTGFVANDYTAWGPFSDALLFIVMFLGGCTGSTAGGVKTFRLVIVWQAVKANLLRTVYPNSVVVMRYDGRPVSDELVLSVFHFMAIYMLVFVVIGLIITAFGFDTLTAFSATIAALSNVGPGLGPIVGPAGNFTAFPDSVLWLLSFAMLVGRLELFTVLVLFAPRFWRG